MTYIDLKAFIIIKEAYYFQRQRRQLEKSLELEGTRGTRRPILRNETRSLIPGVPATTVVSRIPGIRSMIMSRMSREAVRSDIKNVSRTMSSKPFEEIGSEYC